MKSVLLTIALVLWASSAWAQTGAPTSWTMKWYQAGSTTAAQVFIVTRQQATCGQIEPAPQTPPVLNPDTMVWDDPFTAGRVCWFNDAARFAALPDGNYEGTYTAVNSDGPSITESARVPFVRRRPNPPAVPTGTKFIRQAP